jgi:hypothetical protein
MKREDAELDAALAAATAEVAWQAEEGALQYSADDGAIAGRINLEAIVRGALFAARRLRLRQPKRCISGAIYFARCGERIKIGFSARATVRVRGLQTASADPISLLGVMPGSRAVERSLHEKFRALHIRGEWFRAAPRLLQYIERVAPLSQDIMATYAEPVDGPECWDEPVRRSGTRSEPQVRIASTPVRITGC